jgi:hypothetical protein
MVEKRNMKLSFNLFNNTITMININKLNSHKFKNHLIISIEDVQRKSKVNGGLKIKATILEQVRK